MMEENYSHKFIEILKEMLQIEPKKRIKFSTLLNKITYIDDLKGL